MLVWNSTRHASRKIEVIGVTLNFCKAVLATGGLPTIPNYPGLKDAPYTTNEVLFNL